MNEIKIVDVRTWTFHLRTVWLFTFSDLKTIVVPKMLFGVTNALAASVYGIQPASSVSLGAALSAAFWLGINLLPFVIDNQRTEQSIREDKLNKPWRPMPSGRLDPAEAKRWMLTLYPLAFVSSLILGGWKQSLALMLLGYWYNDRGGASGSVCRNFINASGFLCFASGAMEVVLRTPLPTSRTLIQWFVVIFAVVFSTVQTQDLPDQAGDRACGRKTMPLEFGEWKTRVMTSVAMLAWSLLCPWYWRLPLGPYVMFTAVGLVIACRTLLKRQVEDDKLTFRIWNFWMVLLYALPLAKRLFS